ncbi:hypothetical protein I4U23_008047 [Adineta vaga]|nr:hypothetical protein I4U23_008047 [Adineta vaga]
MTDTFVLFSSTIMSTNNHERIRDIQYHIKQLLTELHLIDPTNKILENFQPFNLSTNSHEQCVMDNQCAYLSCKQTRFHSTTCDEYKKVHQRKNFKKMTPKKILVKTSTPKPATSNENLVMKPYLTSTPRQQKRQSTNLIPLKRLLYHQKDSHRQRYSIKRSLNPLDENNLQWI